MSALPHTTMQPSIGANSFGLVRKMTVPRLRLIVKPLGRLVNAISYLQ